MEDPLELPAGLVTAVVDTNSYFAALVAPHSASARLIRAWREGRFRIAASPPLIAELQAVFRNIPARGPIPSHQARAAFIRELEAGTFLVDPPRALALPGISPGDNRLLEAAIASGAAYVVTNDRPVLALGPYEGVAIVTPSRFLEVLALP